MRAICLRHGLPPTGPPVFDFSNRCPGSGPVPVSSSEGAGRDAFSPQVSARVLLWYTGGRENGPNYDSIVSLKGE